MIKEENLVHLTEIRRQLWLGHASLMVGCGFSRNAERATSNTPCPPDWGKLADELITRLYPSYDDKERNEIRSKKNVMQLAEEFEISFQRPALNNLLKELIQDNNLLPGILHKKLLELPWADVFTTNYDTLLERTAKEIINIKYDTVLHCGDLPYSEAPRIIKLHGSFPSESTHLIVTEEDYRTYPDKNSPFVNTVQQSIMETAMCLIGFSGTDPNFLKWIGWVKDNLHDSMPPVYLIGVLELSNAERKVLESKNVIPVDLSTGKGSTECYEQVLNEFCSFMEEGKPSYMDWPQNEGTTFLFPQQKEKNDNIIKAIINWEKQRTEYPSWLYLSWGKRSTLQMYTDAFANNLDYLKRLPNNWDIRGLYELNWRLEKCLLPIPNNLIRDYEEILDKYTDDVLSNEKHCSEIRRCYIELSFAILRWSREELNQEKWNKYVAIVSKLIKDDTFQLNRLYYEKVSYAMMIPNMQEVDEIMAEWETIDHPRIWKVKYASFLAELGNVEKATKQWKNALSELRPFIPKSKIKNDFELLGIEGAILVNLSMAENYYLFNSKLKKTSENQEEKDSGEDAQKKYRERLRELRQYECDPWDILDKFALYFEANKNEREAKETFRDFDTTHTTYHWGSNKSVSYAYQILRFFEETGIPYRVGNVCMNNEAIRQAIAKIIPHSSAWAFVVLNRIGANNEVSCELIFSQEKLNTLKSDSVNALLEKYIEQLQYIINEKANHLELRINDCYKITAKNLYEIISRLSVKASSANLQKMLNLGIQIYSANIHGKYYVFEKIGSRFFKRLFNAMPPEQVFDNLIKILSIKIPVHPETFWESPVLCLDWRGFKSSPQKCSEDLGQTIDSLIQELNHSDEQYRFNILLYLDHCIVIDILSRKQRNALANTLAKYVQLNPVFPNDRFYKFAYLRFLEPIRKKINLLEILKKYYLENCKKIFPIKDGNLSMPIDETQFVIMANSMIVTCSVFNTKQNLYFDLSKEECSQFLCAIKETWDLQKECVANYINTHDNPQSSRDFGGIDIKECLQKTISWLDKLLGEVIIPRIDSEKEISEIEQLQKEVEDCFYLPMTSVALFTKGIKVYNEGYTSKVMEALAGDNKQQFDSYAGSLFNACRFAKKKMLPEPPPVLLQTLIAAIGMRSDECLKIACSIVGSILIYHALNQDNCALLLLYLKNLLDQTDFDSSSCRFNLTDRLDYRQASMFLACKMYCYYSKRNMEMPSVLLKWKEVAESTEEFPSIRNTWLREVNND